MPSSRLPWVVVFCALLWGAAGRSAWSAPAPKKPAAGEQVRLPQKLPDHPRLLIDKDDVPLMRQRAEKTDWGRSFVSKIRRNAQRWLKNEIALPDRGGQWPHWYVCKKDGVRLKTDSPTRHVCPSCGQAYSGSPYDEVVIGSRHSELAQAMLDLGLMHQLGGDEPYAAKAKEILLAYAARYQSYPLHNVNGEPKVGGGRIMAQTLDEASWLITMAQGADLIWPTLSEADRQAAAKGLFLPAAEVIRAHKMKVHNIQCFKNSAVGLVGFLLGDAALIADAITAPQHGFLTQMAEGVSPEGVWYEGSWGYHMFTIGGAWPLTEAAHRCGVNLYGPEFKRMFEAAIELAMPNGVFPLFNDTGETGLRGSSFFELALTRYKDPKFAAVLTGSRASLLALTAGQLELPEVQSAGIGSRNYPVAGYAVLRQGTDDQATWLALKYGPHGGGHGHPDKLNFVLYSRGQVVAPDPGSVAYSAPIHKEWYRTTIAHNTLVVDGQSQNEAQGAPLAFLAGDGLSAALADAGPIYAGVRFRRAVALFGDDLLLFVDQVSCTAPRTLDLAYHNIGTFADKPDGQSLSLPSAPGYMHIQNATVSSPGGSFSAAFTLDRGVASRFTAVLPDGAQVIQGTGVGKNKNDRVPMILVRQKGRELVLGWAVTLGSSEAPRPELRWRKETPGALEAVLGERTCLLVSNPDLRRVRVGAKVVNAPLVCAEKRGDKTTLEQAKPIKR